MARIAKYTFDPQVTAEDFVIGSDSVNKRTRNYKIGDLAAYFETQQTRLIGYKYNRSVDFKDLSSGEISFGNKFQVNTQLKAVTTIYMSPLTLNGIDITDYVSEIMEHGTLKISKSADVGIYRITDIDTIQNGVLELVVDLQLGNGTLTNDDKVYVSANIKADSHYATPELVGDVWEITHNLSKYPSVTVVDTSGNVIYAEIRYDDLNNVTVTFSSPVTGKAYIN